jgi:hypothetical protein
MPNRIIHVLEFIFGKAMSQDLNYFQGRRARNILSSFCNVLFFSIYFAIFIAELSNARR